VEVINARNVDALGELLTPAGVDHTFGSQNTEQAKQFFGMVLQAFPDLRDVLPRIEVPTLLLYGALDQRSPLQVAAELQARIRLRSWSSSRALVTSATPKRPTRSTLAYESSSGRSISEHPQCPRPSVLRNREPGKGCLLRH
jgi:hypothetical protein